MIYLSNLVASVDDFRDYPYTPKSKYPQAASIKEWIGGIEDQGRIGSCVSNSVCSACELILSRSNKFRDLSRRFHYYTGREIDSRLGLSGMTVRSGIKAANKYGIPSESEYPYYDLSETDTKPGDEIYQLAVPHRIFRYERIILNRDDWISNVNAIKSAISEGFPVVIGAQITNRLLDWKPSRNYLGMSEHGSVPLGGHAMLIVGYDSNNFYLENSWGSQWGDNGTLTWGCTGLVADVFEAWVILGFDGIDCVPAVTYKTDPKEVITWYHNVGRIDVNDIYDPNVQYWAKDTDDPDVFYGTFVTIARGFMKNPI